MVSDSTRSNQIRNTTNETTNDMESKQKQLYEAPEMIPIEVSTERMIAGSLLDGTPSYNGLGNEEDM